MNEIEKNKQIVATLSQQLREEFGSKGFDEKNIRRMMQFAKDRFNNYAEED